MRQPLQGTWNIIRFNRHFFILAALLISALLLSSYYLDAGWRRLFLLAALLAIAAVLIPLAVSLYVYDLSGLYQLSWLGAVNVPAGGQLLNIHAGFDETSALIQQRYPAAKLTVLDFYNPAKHTEVSIRRARKAYPPYPGTLRVDTSRLPPGLPAMDVIFVIFAAHEIREEAERVAFFRQLKACLQPGGCIVVTEHLRDTANFLAYNAGCFHFHSRQTWLKTFEQAGLQIRSAKKINPFILNFIVI